MTLEQIQQEIESDPMNEEFTKQDIKPLYQAGVNSKIVIVGEEPGANAEAHHQIFLDNSGDRLREWLGVDKDTFYNPDNFAILPIDFYYPGKGKNGDLPPRIDFAKKYHPLILEQMKDVQLFILVGSFAIEYYMNLKASTAITDIVKNYKDYLPKYFPLIHPSGRNNIWMSKNPWFESDVIPDLQKKVKEIL
jgi:uracil-DNA glycosylase